MAIFDFSDPLPPQPEQPGRGKRFPLKTALAIAVMGGVLAIWRLKVDRGKGMSAGLLAQTFRLHWPSPPPPPVPVQAATRAPGRTGMSESPLFVDASNNLDPFFAALWSLERSKTGVITILHYGDSPTTADLITGEIRSRLQARFGDAGRGYTLIAKPWAWYGHDGVGMSGSGWKTRTAVGLMREGMYGLGGAAFDGRQGAWSKFRLTASPQSEAEVSYLVRPGGGAFMVEADGDRLAVQTTDAPASAEAVLRLALPAGTKTISIEPAEGAVTLFGVDFRRGSTGVLYDSLGLNGATTSVLARVLQPALWKEELAHAHPDLVIINYGSNESSFGDWVHTRYGDELRLAIGRIRMAAPGACILVMSPMDRGERSGLDQIKTMDTIPEIVAIQREVAAETHVAFFDTFDAMGGSGTMARWYGASPRLVTADLLHPTPQGAGIVGALFVRQLSLRYDRWKMRHGIVLPVPVKAAIKVAATGNAPQGAKPHKPADRRAQAG